MVVTQQGQTYDGSCKRLLKYYLYSSEGQEIGTSHWGCENTRSEVHSTVSTVGAEASVPDFLFQADVCTHLAVE